MNTIKQMIGPAEISELISRAMEMRAFSYCPYSGFSVGAALLTSDGNVYTGCNVENAAYGASICAERTAFVKAVSEGECSFRAIAIVGGKAHEAENYSFPCGECRQFMREFCDPETFTVIAARSLTDYRSHLLRDLLPESFGPGNLV